MLRVKNVPSPDVTSEDNVSKDRGTVTEFMVTASEALSWQPVLSGPKTVPNSVDVDSPARKSRGVKAGMARR